MLIANIGIGCPWRGELEQFESHVAACTFASDKLPEWYANYLKSKELEFQKQEQEELFMVSLKIARITKIEFRTSL